MRRWVTYLPSSAVLPTFLKTILELYRKERERKMPGKEMTCDHAWDVDAVDFSAGRDIYIEHCSLCRQYRKTILWNDGRTEHVYNIWEGS